ncbi:hypothetical protein [Ruegeria arenilitoris]|uniref:hypothetical protein n=1 Tax=Ruegeria arenilitoris TaxID=1173585 RepID=UPI001480B3D8|nr:hypothetical protein [Ruegeria arenilitoris]
MKTLILGSAFGLFATTTIADIPPMICEGTVGTNRMPIALSVAGESGVYLTDGKAQLEDLNCRLDGPNISCVWAVGSTEDFLTTISIFVQTDIQRFTQVRFTQFSGDMGNEIDQRIYTTDNFSCR